VVSLLARIILEVDAMLRGKYLAKEYLENTELYSKEEIKSIIKGYDKINSIGINAMSFYLIASLPIKLIVFIMVQEIVW